MLLPFQDVAAVINRSKGSSLYAAPAASSKQNVISYPFIPSHAHLDVNVNNGLFDNESST